MNKVRYVLTGGPGCGKSTLATSLELHGFYVGAEASSDIIRYQRVRNILAPWDIPNFEDQVIRLQELRELQFLKSDEKVAFFDRGLLDALAYFQLKERKISPHCAQIFERLRNSGYYNTVFYLNSLEEYNGNCLDRPETFEEAKRLGEFQRKNYQHFGFNVVDVPATTVDKRKRFILDHIYRSKHE